jgi:hypothetical protein
MVVVATLCLTVAAASRAAAQGSGDEWHFGALYDPVFHVPSETSSVGVHFDVSKTVVERMGANVQGVGELGFNHFDGATFSSFLGGGRVASSINPKLTPFFQFLVGPQHCCDSTDFAIQPGVGIDYDWNPIVTLRVQLDFRRVFFEGDSESATRLGIGVTIPFRTK